MVQQNHKPCINIFLGKRRWCGCHLRFALRNYIVGLPKPSPIVEDLFGGFSALEHNRILFILMK